MDQDPARYVAYLPRIVCELRPPYEAGWWTSHGSLVFADISGFTKLAEKLARSGKAGAEELVLTLSAVFTELLTASCDGGDVVKFGGDALLIAYAGDEHAARAAHAASRMQRALRTIGRIATASGPVRLRMSVGIASGSLTWLLVGDAHLELMVIGPTASATVAMESAADAGEVLLAPSTAAAVPVSWRGTPRAGGLLLGRVPVLPPLTVHDPPSAAGRERFVPLLLRERLGRHDLGYDHEHRVISPAFVHLAGVDALVADGPAAAFDALQRAALAVESVTRELEICIIGADIAADGAKYMLVSGAPDARDDDEARMLVAARRIVDRVVAECPELRVRIGVHRGRAFGGDVGAPFRRTYSTMGDPVNLAARLMGAAPWGAVLAHDDVVARGRARVLTEPVPPFTVKGKSRPVIAHLVRSIASRATATPRRDVPLVGRDRELSALAEAVATVRTGTAFAVHVHGERGIGKSRLLDAVFGAHPDVERIDLHADPYRRSTPFDAIAPLVRRTLGDGWGAPSPADGLIGRIAATAPHLVAWAPLLGRVLGIELPSTPEVDDVVESFREARTVEVVTEWLHTTLPAGSAIVVDDVEWLDEATARVVASLSRRTGTARLVLTTSARADTRLDGARVIELGPLDPDAAGALVRAAESSVGAAGRIDEVVARGGGNPLFLLELVDLPEGDGLPPSVEAVLTARIDRLDTADRRLLRRAAVAGTSFDADVVEQLMVDDPHFGERWTDLQRFVRFADRTGEFVDRSTRDAAYEGLSFVRRRELHGTVAAALGARGAPPALVSEHWWYAGRWREAWRSAAAAAADARAARRSTRLPPCTHAPTGRRHTSRRSTTAKLPIWSTSRWHTRRQPSSPADLRRPRTRSGQPRDSQPTRPAGHSARCEQRGSSSERGGTRPRFASPVRAAREAATLADPRASAGVRGSAEALLCGLRLRQGRLRDAARHGRLALTAAQASGDRATEARALFLLDAILTDLGDPAVAEVRDRALPIFEELGDLVGQADTLNNLGINAYWEGRWTDALDLYERARTLRERAGDLLGAATQANNAGEVLSDQGRLVEAEVVFEDVVRTCRSSGYRLLELAAAANLGRARVRSGQLASAATLLEDAERGFAALGLEGWVVDTRARRVELLLAQARHDDAAHLATTVLQAATTTGNVAVAALLHRLLGDARLAAGQPGPARASYARSLDLADQVGARIERARTLEALADLDGLDDEHPTREAARSILRSLGVAG